MYYVFLNFPRGKIFLAKTDKGLSCAWYMKSQEEFKKIDQYFRKRGIVITRKPEKFHKEEKLFASYFNGERVNFTSLPLDFISATPYQKKVWLAARNIPYGKTVTYKSLAHKLKHRGYRSVGQAMARNPLLIVIPCHRVLSSDGSLGGFSGGGLELKEYLLKLEKVKILA